MRLVFSASTIAVLGLALAACALPGCGSDGPGASTAITVRFAISKGGADVACASLGEISAATIAVYAADGVTTRAGYPRALDCAAGSVDLTGLPAGQHVVEIVAKGELAGDASAILYRARASFTTPADTAVTLSLKPEIAHLSVGWTFASGDLLPCTTEVAEVEVLVSAGSSQATSFHQRVDCNATPVTIDAPLPLLSFTVQVNAYSSQEFILFSATAVRALERGDNAVDLVLQPGGGQLFFDWTFALRSQMIRACDDPRVGASEVSARVRSLEGGPAATDRFPCAVARPYVFLPQRYRPGRMLEIELVAEGAERYVGKQTITMPDGDYDQDPPLVLQAVGTATAAVTVRTSTCAGLVIDGIDVAVYPAEDTRTAVFSATIPLGKSSVLVADLPYADYVVDVAQKRAGQRLCAVRERRTMDARWSTWDPFVL